MDWNTNARPASNSTDDMTVPDLLPPQLVISFCALIDLFSSRQGIFISRVSKGGPAEKAGLHVGDRVLEVK